MPTFQAHSLEFCSVLTYNIGMSNNAPQDTDTNLSHTQEAPPSLSLPSIDKKDGNSSFTNAMLSKLSNVTPENVQSVIYHFNFEELSAIGEKEILPNILLSFALNHQNPLAQAASLQLFTKYSTFSRLQVANTSGEVSLLYDVDKTNAENLPSLDTVISIWDRLMEMTQVDDSSSDEQVYLVQEALATLSSLFSEMILLFGQPFTNSIYHTREGCTENVQRIIELFRKFKSVNDIVVPNRLQPDSTGKANPNQKMLYNGLAEMTRSLISLNQEATGVGTYYKGYYGRTVEGTTIPDTSMTEFARHIRKSSDVYLFGVRGQESVLSEGIISKQLLYFPEALLSILPDQSFHKDRYHSDIDSVSEATTRIPYLRLYPRMVLSRLLTWENYPKDLRILIGGDVKNPYLIRFFETLDTILNQRFEKDLSFNPDKSGPSLAEQSYLANSDYLRVMAEWTRAMIYINQIKNEYYKSLEKSNNQN